MHATRLWAVWQGLIQSFAHCFTRPGWRRFVEWVTALTLNVEEHTITQSVTAIERTADWKALESFAEYGRWDTDAVIRNLARLVETAPGRIWHGYHVSAVDDTKVHRSGEHVWGTCTFHEVHRPLLQPGDHRPGPQLGHPAQRSGLESAGFRRQGLARLSWSSAHG
ncbi:MAG TPA: transposase [Isosphaeraceae bacterium]|nr:transposase [Isosphaeraceae bacterium]